MPTLIYWSILYFRKRFGLVIKPKLSRSVLAAAPFDTQLWSANASSQGTTYPHIIYFVRYRSAPWAIRSAPWAFHPLNSLHVGQFTEWCMYQPPPPQVCRALPGMTVKIWCKLLRIKIILNKIIYYDFWNKSQHWPM